MNGKPGVLAVMAESADAVDNGTEGRSLATDLREARATVERLAEAVYAEREARRCSDNATWMKADAELVAAIAAFRGEQA